MNDIDRQRVIHELSQAQLQMAATDLNRHLGRVKIEPFTREKVEGLLKAFEAKNELVSELYEEIDRLKAVAK